MVIWFN